MYHVDQASTDKTSDNVRHESVETMMTCPYNINHLVRESRMSLHISKCRGVWIRRCVESGVIPEVVQCKYNYLHTIFIFETGFHYEHLCSNRNQPIQPTAQSTVTSSPEGIVKVPSDEEDWGQNCDPKKFYTGFNNTPYYKNHSHQ